MGFKAQMEESALDRRNSPVTETSDDELEVIVQRN